MAVNFKGITTTRGRRYETPNLIKINEGLKPMPIDQRAAILGTIIEESGGNPLAISDNGTYQGLLQWGADRYRPKVTANDVELDNQIQYIKNTINNSTDGKSWTHGGKGSGYNSKDETYNTFHNDNAPFDKKFRAFSYGYVRPKGKEDSYNNRLKVGKKVLNKLVVDEVLSNPRIPKKWTPRAWEKPTRFPSKYDEGGYLDENSWDNLSMKEKAEMMRVAIANGITTLPEIRQAYNKFARGGKMNNWTMQDEAGYRAWRSKLPSNLRDTNDNDYDMRGAYKAGMQPVWNPEDKSYHLDSRDPKTGKILKRPHHPTYLMALAADASLGYYPIIDSKGNTYTATWKGNKFEEGGEKESYIDADDRRHKIILETKDGNLYDSNGNNYTQSYLDEENVPVITGTMPRNISQYYDPNTTLDFINAATSPISNFTPSNIWGSIRESNNANEFLSHYMNYDTSGFFPEEYAEDHPITTLLGNIAGDVAMEGVVDKGIDMFRDLTSNSLLYKKGLTKLRKLGKKIGIRPNLNKDKYVHDYNTRYPGLAYDLNLDNGNYDLQLRAVNNYAKKHPDEFFGIGTKGTREDLKQLKDFYSKAFKLTPEQENTIRNKWGDKWVRIMNNNPEYFKFVEETNMNPTKQETVDAFLKRQGTSVRGVSAKDEQTAIKYLTETGDAIHRQGGDRLGTNGGLYTSNSTDISDRFKNPLSKTLDGWVGELNYDWNIDRNLPIEDQLYQQRQKVMFSPEYSQYIFPIDSETILKNNPSAVAIEANYMRRTGQMLPANERAYLPSKSGNIETPVTISKLTHYPNQQNAGGRWGAGNVSDNLFISKEPNSTTDFIRDARILLEKAPFKINPELWEKTENDIKNRMERRINKRNELLDKAIKAKETFDNVKFGAEYLGQLGLPVLKLGVPALGFAGISKYVYDQEESERMADILEKDDKEHSLMEPYRKGYEQYYKELTGKDWTPTTKKALGGNLFGGGGYIPSNSIKKRISDWEGSSMKTNRSFDAETKDFNKVIPAEIRSKLSSDQLDALYSYGYNVGMGRLKERVLPALTAYTQGKASREDVQRSMWASLDNKLRGLNTRRNAERALFGGNFRTTFTDKGNTIGSNIDLNQYLTPKESFDALNTQIANINIPKQPLFVDMPDPTTVYTPPVIDTTFFNAPKKVEEEPIYDPKKENMKKLQTFNTIMGLMGGTSPFTELISTDTPGILSYVNQIYN